MRGRRQLTHVFTLLMISVVLVSIGLTSRRTFASEPEYKVAPLKPAQAAPVDPRLGYVPPRFDLSHIKPAMPRVVPLSLPTRFDWREQGKVTAVQDQSSCGACYAFAALGCIESRMLIAGEGFLDFSENNLKECNWYDTSCEGGNWWKGVNYLSKLGTVLESCDPYVASDVSCKSTCPYMTTVLDWRVISGGVVPSANVLKTYLQSYGPVYAALYADASYGFDMGYDGSYTFYYPGSETPNHAVLLVGWDDSLPHSGGQGAWIVKNSYGGSWGGPCGYGTEGGYFTIAYGSANFGASSSFLYEWQDYDPVGELLYYDQGGVTVFSGFSNTTAWGLCKFIAPNDVVVQRVEFWTNDATTNIDVYVYDGFDGSSLGILLASETGLSFENAGYHSVELSFPPAVSTGDTICAVIKVTNETSQYPLPIDYLGTPSMNRCYVSATGITWLETGFNYGEDVGIRVRVTEDISTRTWHVPSEVPTIQAAIDSSADGDTVLIANNTYTGEANVNLNFSGKGITVMSESGNPDSCIIDCESSPFGCIYFVNGESGTSVLEGVTIKRGGYYEGGGICCSFASPTIRNCRVQDGTSTRGGGIFVRGGSPYLFGCVFSNNTATEKGGGMYLENATPLLLACTFIDNYCSEGAGVYCSSTSWPLITNSIITFCGTGAAVECDGTSQITITCSDVYYNTGGDWVGCIAGQSGLSGNISENPIFCDWPGGDCSLQASSPCITGYGCGQIGAHGQGCSNKIPDQLTSFTVTASEHVNTLKWELPSDPDCDGVRIMYSTVGYPSSPFDGNPVENGNSGYFPKVSAVVDSFAHQSLVNGTTYYYAAYTYNENWFGSAGLTASGTPQDSDPPVSVSSFIASAGESQVTLSWTNPGDSDLAGIIVRYSTTAYPSSHSDGTPVENGSGGVFVGTPGQATSFPHTGLTNGTTYYYSAFAYDEVPNYSPAATASGTPGDETPPSSLASFTATPRDISIRLLWTNPSDTDFSGTLIRYSTSGYPSSITDGAVVDNGQAGQFYNVPASVDSFLHSGLTNGTTYYYTAFAFDGVPNYASPVTTSGMPVDELAPSPVAGFTLIAGDTTISLGWTNPSDGDFAHTLIRYSTTTYASTPSEGTAIENGENGIFVNSPGSSDGFTHTHLTNGVTYYYSAFSGDEVPNYSSPAQKSISAEDLLAPLPVASLTATPRDGLVKLKWTNPGDADFKGSLMRYSTSVFPATVSDGTPVENGAEGKFANTPASVDSFVHADLTNGTTYYYSVFAYDEVPNYSARDTVRCTPQDMTPPELSVSVFQNPFITNHLDIYVVASEAIIDTSLHCRIAGDEIAMTVTDPDEYICRGDYDLFSTGTLSIDVSARDLSLNRGHESRTFSSSLILASSGGMATSPYGRVRARFKGDAILRDAYILIFEPEKELLGGSSTYQMSPAELPLDDLVEVSITYSLDTQEPERLCIARFDEGRALLVDSYIDRENGRVVAYADRLGSFGLTQASNSLTPDLGNGELIVLQNVPNPFAGSTTITFDVPKGGRVSAEVISVGGRVIKTLVNDQFGPGRHNISWDGTDDNGRDVASGVYLYRFGCNSRSITKKMVHLR